MVTRLRHVLRDLPLARAIAIRLYAAAVRDAGKRGDAGVLILAYHDMRARDRGRFARQLDMLSAFGPIVALGAALEHLRSGTGPNGSGWRVCLTFDDGLQGAFQHAWPVLMDKGIQATFFVVPAWIDAARPGTLTWEECRILARSGMEVGSHSLTHRRLALLDKAEVVHELAVSRARIEAEVGTRCLHFACPWGQPTVDYDPARDPALAGEAGYRSFLTTVQRRAGVGADRMSLPRVRMEPHWGSAELRYALARGR